MPFVVKIEKISLRLSAIAVSQGIQVVGHSPFPMPGIFYVSPCMHLSVLISQYLSNVGGLQHLAGCVLLSPRGHELLHLLSSKKIDKIIYVVLEVSQLLIIHHR